MLRARWRATGLLLRRPARRHWRRRAVRDQVIEVRLLRELSAGESQPLQETRTRTGCS